MPGDQPESTLHYMLSFGEGVMGRTVRSPAIPGEAVKGDMEVDKGWSAKSYPVYKDSAPADV